MLIVVTGGRWCSGCYPVALDLPVAWHYGLVCSPRHDVVTVPVLFTLICCGPGWLWLVCPHSPERLIDLLTLYVYVAAVVVDVPGAPFAERSPSLVVELRCWC